MLNYQEGLTHFIPLVQRTSCLTMKRPATALGEVELRRPLQPESMPGARGHGVGPGGATGAADPVDKGARRRGGGGLQAFPKTRGGPLPP